MAFYNQWGVMGTDDSELVNWGTDSEFHAALLRRSSWNSESVPQFKRNYLPDNAFLAGSPSPGYYAGSTPKRLATL
jgi:hypothetical protein